MAPTLTIITGAQTGIDTVANDGRAPHGVYLMGVYLTGVHLMGTYLINVHLMGVHLTGVHLMGVYLTGLHLIGVYLIYESSLRVGHGWRECLYRHPGWLKSF